jgi:hypothetical protein
MTMVWRKVAHIALGCALLIGFQLYGIAGLVQNEPPRGSVFGVAYSEHTLAPIPGTLVRLTLISPPETPTQPEERPAPAPREPQEMQYRHQGWDRSYWYECGYEFRVYSEGRTWEAITDEHGRFQLRGIPVGVYSVETSSKWSHAHQSEVVVREGERLDLSLAIQPPAPFLDLIHPQSVYHPDEPLRVGVRGFSEDDTIQLTLARVRQKTKDALPSELHALLDEIRYGWWRDDAVLEEQLKRYNAYYETEWSGDTPVRGRDPEGVFTQYVDLPKQRDGTYLLQAQVGQKRRAALIVVSSIGVVSKVSRESTELWCTDLRTGQPVEQVLVRVYRSQRARAEGAPARKEMRLVAEARTNRDGLARLRQNRAPRGLEIQGYPHRGTFSAHGRPCILGACAGSPVDMGFERCARRRAVQWRSLHRPTHLSPWAHGSLQRHCTVGRYAEATACRRRTRPCESLC